MKEPFAVWWRKDNATWPIRLDLNSGECDDNGIGLTIEEAQDLIAELERVVMTYNHAQAKKMRPEQIERFIYLAMREEG